MTKRDRKKARASFEPAPQKTPTVGTKVGGQEISWRFSTGDRNGAWAWTAIADDTLYREIIERLAAHETMSLIDIESAGSHWIDISRFKNKDVGKRLQEIQKDDIDGLFSFRITGKKRVFCIRRQNVMNVLWWDPNHEVYYVNVADN